MDSLDQRSIQAREMPRFDDGMANLQEFIRIMAESLVNEIMDVQAGDACADGNRRNGYRGRTLITSVGPINLRIPKLRRGSHFPEDLIVRYSRVDRAVIAAVSEMVTSGVSTRKVERIAAQTGIDRMGSSRVSCICESPDETVGNLQIRDLSEAAYPCIWLDATYIKCRDGAMRHPARWSRPLERGRTAIAGCWGQTPSTRNHMRDGSPFCARSESAGWEASSA